MSANLSSISPHISPYQQFEIWAAEPEGCVYNLILNTMEKVRQVFKNNEPIRKGEKIVDQEIESSSNKIHQVFYMRLKMLIVAFLKHEVKNYEHEKLVHATSNCLKDTLIETQQFDTADQEIMKNWMDEVSLNPEDNLALLKIYIPCFNIHQKEKYKNLTERDWKDIYAELFEKEASPASSLGAATYNYSLTIADKPLQMGTFKKSSEFSRFIRKIGQELELKNSDGNPLSKSAKETLVFFSIFLEGSKNEKTREILPIILQRTIVKYCLPSDG